MKVINMVIFCHFLNNIGFLVRGKLIKKSVLGHLRFRINLYVVAPYKYLEKG
jgi:hypothetical protein